MKKSLLLKITLVFSLILILVLPYVSSSEAASKKDKVQRVVFSTIEKFGKKQYKNLVNDIILLPAKEKISPSLLEGKYKVGTILSGKNIQTAARDFNSSAYGKKEVIYLNKSKRSLDDLLNRLNNTKSDMLVKNTSTFRVEAEITLKKGRLKSSDPYGSIKIIFRQVTK